MEISIKWNICRICLREEHKTTKPGANGTNMKFLPLFTEHKKLSLQIYDLTGVSMKSGDLLPEKICRNCVQTLNSALQFRKNCCSSDSYLQSILERTKSASSFPKPEIKANQIVENDVKAVEEDTQLESEDNNLENEADEGTYFPEEADDSSKNCKTVFDLHYQEIEIDADFNDSSSAYIVEMEEIVEIPDRMEDQLYAQAIINDTDEFTSTSQNIIENNTVRSKPKKSEMSQLQKFYMTASFSKQKVIEDKHDNHNTNDLTIDANKEDEVLKEPENSASIEDSQFFAVDENDKIENDIEEALMLHLEEKINDNENQTQVSSTVNVRDETECFEDSTNMSSITSDIEKESLESDNVSNCNISSTKPTEEIDEASSHENKITKKVNEKRKRQVVSSKQEKNQNGAEPGGSYPFNVRFCDICGNRFTDRYQLKVHMNLHWQMKNYQCELCSKSFMNACNLQAHMRVHTGEKPFECKYCGRRFSDRSSNIRHERIHTNEKPYECSHCGRKFSLGTTLQNHMKVHSNERSYSCEPCGKSFKLPHHLKTHKNTSLHRSIAEVGENES